MTRWSDILPTIAWSHDVEIARWQHHKIHFGFTGIGAPVDPTWHHGKQVHGTAILAATSEMLGSQPPCCDGLYTLNKNTAVAIKTADCLPVLMFDIDARFAAAIHAGWRGLCAGIFGQLPPLLDRLSMPMNQIHAAIGPAISRNAYEVGSDVAEAMQSKDAGFDQEQVALCLHETDDERGDKWFLDLPLAGAFALINAGLNPHHIAVIQQCTFSHRDNSPRWHSHRREGLARRGSNWSWIRL